MAYNSSHTGAQIDAAISAVRQKESNWDGKQDALVGSNGQIVVFNAEGKPVAGDMSSSGFEIGDILLTTRTDLGEDWLLCNGEEYLPSEYPSLAAMSLPYFGEKHDLIDDIGQTQSQSNRLKIVYDSNTNRWVIAFYFTFSSGNRTRFYYKDRDGNELVPIDYDTSRSGAPEWMTVKDGAIYALINGDCYVCSNYNTGFVTNSRGGGYFLQFHDGVWAKLNRVSNYWRVFYSVSDSFPTSWTEVNYSGTNTRTIPTFFGKVNGIWIVQVSDSIIYYSTETVPTNFTEVTINDLDLRYTEDVFPIIYFKKKYYLFITRSANSSDDPKYIDIFSCDDITTGAFNFVQTLETQFYAVAFDELNGMTTDGKSIAISLTEGVLSTTNPEGAWSYQSFSDTQIGSFNSRETSAISYDPNAGWLYVMSNNDISREFRTSLQLPMIANGAYTYIKAK